jgi:HEAT repeat protein
MSAKEITSTGLRADGTHETDTSGRPITPRRRRWGMKVNIWCAGLGTLFAVAFWPGNPVFSLWLTERLHASLTQVGLFTSIAGLGMVLQFLGVFIFDRTRTRKTLWVTLVLAYRVMGFATVGFAVYWYLTGAYQEGVANGQVWLLLSVMAVGFSIAQMTATAWWSWMADLAPKSIRGRFLANRQLAAQVAALVGTLPIILLDVYGKDAGGKYTETADLIFIGLFAVCTLSGIIDIIIHGFIPEPARRDRPDQPSFRETLRGFREPFLNRRFFRFAVAFALTGFGAMLSAPFVWPYLKSEKYLNIDYSWFYVWRVLFAVTILLGSRYWGMLIDRFGAKPVLAITYAAGFLNVYLLFITPESAPWLVCTLSGVVGGFMWSGLMVANPQLMLTLAPEKRRNSYVAVYALLTGVGLIIAPMVGGWMGDRLTAWLDTIPVAERTLPWGTVITYMQILVLVSLLWRLCVYPLIFRIREGKEKPVGTVLSTVLGVNQFRTMYAMRLFAGRSTSRRLDALRGMGRASDQLAVEDLIGQLEDPEPDIRREAALALGRIGGPEAVTALVQRLTTPESDVQPEAARALGLTGDHRALAPLLEKLGDPNEIIREQAAGALGELASPDAADALMNVLKNDPSPNVSGRGALSLAKIGVMDAIWEILPKMHQTSNVALRRQLATAVGNLIGEPGTFHDLLTSEFRHPGGRVVRRVKEIRGNLRERAKRMRSGGQFVETERLKVAVEAVDRAMDEFELTDYDLALGNLHAAAVEMARGLYGFEGAEDVAVEFALSRSGLFGVGLWFLQVGKEYADRGNSRDELLRLDALLGFHFLSHFTRFLV